MAKEIFPHNLILAKLSDGNQIHTIKQKEKINLTASYREEQNEMWEILDRHLGDRDYEEALELITSPDFHPVCDDPLTIAVWKNSDGLLHWLIDEGYSPNDPQSSISPLAWAARKGRIDMMNSLLAAGARISLERPECGSTSLHIAAEKNQLAALRLLLEQPGSSCAFLTFDYIDRTPLHCAVQAASARGVEILLKAGHPVDALVQEHDEGRIGDTPLRLAVTEGHLNIVKLLLEAGADPDRGGWMGVSARMEAEDAGKDMLEILEWY